MAEKSLREIVESLEIGGELTDQAGGLYLRVDVDATGDEDTESHDAVWDRYCEIVEALERAGLGWAVNQEFDCIMGYVDFAS